MKSYSGLGEEINYIKQTNKQNTGIWEAILNALKPSLTFPSSQGKTQSMRGY